MTKVDIKYPGNPSLADEKPMNKKRIMKNLIIICIGFLLLFSAFQALANLQSTINSEEGLGVASQSVIYVALIISSMFLPTVVIKRLGCKRTLVLSILTYCPYIAANFYPHWGTFIPAAVLLGLGAAPLWSAKCTYLNEIGFLYASYGGKESADAVISRFFGIFFMIFQNTQIWGNLVSYYVLKPENSTKTLEREENNLTILHCGSVFCPDSVDSPNATNPNLNPPSDEKRYMLIGIYLAFGLLSALVVAIFLDPLKRKEDSDKLQASLLSRLVATFKHLRKLNQILLVPITIYSGIEQAFFLSEFTRAYIACAWGVHHVGFVFICFGIVNAVMSFTAGKLVRYLSRFPIMLFGAAGNVATCIALFLWQPDPENPIVFFVIAGIWGLSDAIWQTQINALYGVLFKDDEEPAFSNYRLWESLGFMIAFAYSNVLCVQTKMYILLCLLAVGISGYLSVEVRNNGRKSKYDIS